MCFSHSFSSLSTKSHFNGQFNIIQLVNGLITWTNVTCNNKTLFHKKIETNKKKNAKIVN